MKINAVKSITSVLSAVLFTAQFAQADVAFLVEGSKKSIQTYGGISYSVIETTEGERIYLTKKSAKKFADCDNGEYQVVRKSVVGPELYLLLNMNCHD